MNPSIKWSWLVLMLAISPRLVMAVEPISMADLLPGQPLAGPTTAGPTSLPGPGPYTNAMGTAMATDQTVGGSSGSPSAPAATAVPALLLMVPAPSPIVAPTGRSLAAPVSPCSSLSFRIIRPSTSISRALVQILREDINNHVSATYWVGSAGWTPTASVSARAAQFYFHPDHEPERIRSRESTPASRCSPRSRWDRACILRRPSPPEPPAPPPAPGPPVGPFTMEITSKLEVQVADVEVFQETTFGHWNLLLAGGFSYANIVQDYGGGDPLGMWRLAPPTLRQFLCEPSKVGVPCSLWKRAGRSAVAAWICTAAREPGSCMAAPRRRSRAASSFTATR